MVMKKIFNFFTHRKNSTNISKEQEIVFFDPLTGEKFKATRFEVLKAFSDLNKELERQRESLFPKPIYLNELYSRLPNVTKKRNQFPFNRFGWRETDFPILPSNDFSFEIGIDQESSQPIMVLKYNIHDFEAESSVY